MKRQTILVLAIVFLGVLAGCAKDSDLQPQPLPEQDAGDDLSDSIDDAANIEVPQAEVDSEITGLEEDLSDW